METIKQGKKLKPLQILFPPKRECNQGIMSIEINKLKINAHKREKKNVLISWQLYFWHCKLIPQMNLLPAYFTPLSVFFLIFYLMISISEFGT